jgi:kumamolisin
VPRELEAVIQAVLGLDDRPQANTNIRVLSDEHLEAAKDRAYTPTRLAELYDFPRDCDGTGQRIAVIELGGGYRRAELLGYFRQLGVGTPRIRAVSVDGARNNPDVDRTADAEVRLDLEVIGAVAPGAEQLVYFAPMTDRGFLDAITTAIFDPRAPSIISISWGGPEGSWTEQARIALDDAFHAAAALGITVCAASGDDGWTDILGSKTAHVDYPASSPYVLACGGTRLELQNGSVVEAVWNDHDGHATGGGVSELYEVPNWQQSAKVPNSVNPGGRRGRGVPDVAGNADPGTGYLIGDGKTTHAQGGTSAVAPLWAGLVARLNERLGGRSGFLNPLLYESVDASVFNDVPTGTNGAYRARKGVWDACTGHGSPRGTALVEALAGPGMPASNP